MDKYNRILQLINEYLMERFNYKTLPAYYSTPKTTICVRRKKVDLYLRIVSEDGGFWRKNTLVIARIGFQRERMGHGTHLLRFLVSLALEYGYDYIGIESANNNSSSFAKKFNFEQINDSNHYVISTTTLENIL